MKKTIIFIIAFSLIISSAIPVYADDISTGSAINSINNIKAVSDTKAAGDTVDPVSSTGTRYSLSSNGVGTANAIISKWADIVTHLTYSFAYSADYIRTAINNIYNIMTSYFRSTNTTSYYYWDWTPTGGVNQGAPETTETIIQAVRNIGMQTTKSLAYSTEYLYQLYDKFINGTGFDVNVANNNFDKWLNVGYGKFDQYYSNPGTYNQQYRLWDITNSSSYLYALLDSIVRSGNTLATISALTNYRGYISYLDDNLIVQQGNWFNSFPQAIKEYGYFIQSDLKRLRYVLASDDEIAAREAAQDNQDAFVNDFLDSNGAGSASASDIGDMSGISSSVQDILSTGVSPTSAFSSMDSNSSAWDWFKNDTKNALDTTSSNRRNIKSSDSDTPLLDNYYSDLQEKLKVYKK